MYNKIALNPASLSIKTIPLPFPVQPHFTCTSLMIRKLGKGLIQQKSPLNSVVLKKKLFSRMAAINSRKRLPWKKSVGR